MNEITKLFFPNRNKRKPQKHIEVTAVFCTMNNLILINKTGGKFYFSSPS